MTRDSYSSENTNASLFTSAICPHCGALDLFIKPRPPHLGLYCGSCSRWIKWIAHRPIQTMPFGKHRGCAIADLPHAYLNWVLENLELKKPIYDALNAEYERRGRNAA